MKHHLFIPILSAAIVSVVAACSESCSEAEPQKSAVAETKCIVAGYSMATRITTSDPKDYPYLKYPTRVYCFGISPDTEGVWYVDPSREAAHTTVRKALTESQEAFLVVGGGATAGNMYTMGTDAAKRTAFADALVAYAHARQFDGIDVDWETDWSSEPFKYVPADDLIALLSAIRERMEALPSDARVRQLTVALSSNLDGRAMGGKVAPYVDHINVMIYDTYGTAEEGYPHAPMRVVKESLAGYEANGVPASKIILGVPFYGGDKSRTPVATQTYRSLCSLSGGKITSATNSWGGYAFNGADLMREKTQYVLDKGYAGIMIWELSQDLDYEHPLSLMRAIRSVAEK